MTKACKIVTIALLLSSSVFAQSSVPKGWHMMDKETSGYYGVSADKAYEFLKSKKLKSR